MSRFTALGICLSLAGCALDSGADDLSASMPGGAGSAGAGPSATGGSAGVSTGGSAGTTSAGTANAAGSGGSTAGGSAAAGTGPKDPCIEAGTCPVGEWINVTPTEISLDPNVGGPGNNFGVQDVIVDPARPNDFYAFVCYQGVWKSSDYGMTWSKVSTGTNAAHLESGRPWTAAIDPNPGRSPDVEPTLYTVAGYGDQLGVYKSTDGGKNFENYAVNNTEGVTSSDVYSLDVDPYDSKHLIAGFHDVGLSESHDGGETWSTLSVPSNLGSSVYIWFVHTGSATTSTTWITQAQWNDNGHGMWRTTNSGAEWTQVQPKLEHGHGSAQIFQDGNGNVYASGAAAGTGVIFRSTDFGLTWAAANNGGVGQNGVFGTPNYVYASLPAAATGGTGQHLQRSPASDGVSWSDWDPIAPEGMIDGAKRAAVTYDGEHYVIVSGNWGAGIWRYTEP